MAGTARPDGATILHARTARSIATRRSARHPYALATVPSLKLGSRRELSFRPASLVEAKRSGQRGLRAAPIDKRNKDEGNEEEEEEQEPEEGEKDEEEEDSLHGMPVLRSAT